MDEYLLDRELEAACDVARIAWKRIAPYYGGSYQVVEKDNGDGPVTPADHEASETIMGELARRFPGYGLLSEEAKDDFQRLESERIWVIDPIDGTKEFIRGKGSFAIQIGLVVATEDGYVPVVGVVYHPTEDRLYGARLGAGTWVEIQGEGRQSIRVSRTDRPEEMVCIATRSHRTPSIRRLVNGLMPRKAVSTGSVGIKMAWIAEGRADYYINDSRGGCKEWDLCAPQIVLTEAGGRVTDFAERPFRYNRRDVRLYEGILASNGACHGELCRRITELEKIHAENATETR